VNFMTLSMRRVVHVAKLCIEIPDSLYEWLREIAKEMATTPEAFMEQLLWQYHSVGQATLRTRCRPRQ
jgi:predicted transcriptional regulator